MDEQSRDQLRRILIADEGIVQHAYQDSLGYWTIGCGRMIDKRRGGGITYTEALYLLENDIASCEAELTERFPWFATLDPVRQVVLVSLCFNMGIASLSKFTNTLAAFARGDFEAASEGLKASQWFRQVQPSRSERLIVMTRTGEWPHTVKV